MRLRNHAAAQQNVPQYLRLNREARPLSFVMYATHDL
jgi:hypothetical protein